MRKTILTILGSALIVSASVQFADAAQRHQGKANQTVTSEQQSRNADAYAAWPAPTVRPVTLFRRLFGARRTLTKNQRRG